MSHTPSPWEIEPNGRRPRIVGPLEEGPTFAEYDIGLPGPRRRVIAECCGAGNEGIIRAAPDIFTALKRYVDYWGNLQNIDEDDTELLAIGQAALARAAE